MTELRGRNARYAIGKHAYARLAEEDSEASLNLIKRVLMKKQ